MNKTFLIPVAFLFTACASFAPQEGTWSLSSPEITEDSCGFSDQMESDGDSTFSIALTDDGFSITGEGDGAKAVSCALDGKNFTCDDTVEKTEESTFTLTTTISYDGSFTSETEASVNIGVNIACEGDDCALVEAQTGFSLPCDLKGTSSATAQ